MGSIEISNVDDSKYSIKVTDLTSDFINTKLYSAKEAGYMLGECLNLDFTGSKARSFMTRKLDVFNCIKYGKYTYFLKNEIDAVYKELKQLCSAREALYKVNEKLGLDIPRVPDRSSTRNMMKLFDSYCLEKSNSYGGKTPVDMFTRFKYIHQSLIARLTKEVYDLDSDELQELINYIGQYTKEAVREFKMFYNIAVEKMNKSDKKIPAVKKKTKVIPPYEIETYFSILAELMNKICEPKFIVLLTGDKSLSSLVLYIYTHYISVWRRGDILEKLSNQNLKLIGFDSGDEFVK